MDDGVTGAPPRHPPYDLVLFDFDGTLADSFPWFTGALNAAAERHGFTPVEAHEVDALRAMSGRELLRHLGIRGWQVPRVAADLRRAMAALDPPPPLFAGVPELLRRLAERGVAAAVVSSNGEENVRRGLGPDCASRVRFLACGAPLFGKARQFRRVVRASRVPPARVLCVGDERRDLEAARAAGLAAGAGGWGDATADALRALGPEELFESVAAMTERLAPG